MTEPYASHDASEIELALFSDLSEYHLLLGVA
jgi:hypothetical protein